MLKNLKSKSSYRHLGHDAGSTEALTVKIEPSVGTAPGIFRILVVVILACVSPGVWYNYMHSGLYVINSQRYYIND